MDATYSGSLSRFVNHSCDPNCKLVIALRKNEKTLAIGLIAKKEISSGSELTIDYAWSLPSNADEPSPEEACLCGAPTCRKMLFKIEDEQSPYLLKIIKPKDRTDRTSYDHKGKHLLLTHHCYLFFTIVLKYFKNDPVHKIWYRKWTKRTVNGNTFTVTVGDHVEIYYDAFNKMEETSDYNSIFKVLMIMQNLSTKKSFVYGRWFRFVSQLLYLY